jgi:ketosteroid isomerase-like protein
LRSPVGRALALATEADYRDATARNRALFARMFAHPAAFGRGCIEHIADEVSFHLIGDTVWSGRFKNKSEWAAQVFFALPHALRGPIDLRAEQILVAGDLACVRARGAAVAVTGARYDNDYCLVYRLRNGVIVEATEYLDTELITRAFGSTPYPRRDGVLARFARVSVSPGESVLAPSDCADSRASLAAIAPLVSTPFELAQVLEWLDPGGEFRLMGQTAVSGSYRGPVAARRGIVEPLAARLSTPLTLHVTRCFADRQWVCLQANASATLSDGSAYLADCCALLKCVEGAIIEVVVYHDSERLAAVLDHGARVDNGQAE